MLARGFLALDLALLLDRFDLGLGGGADLVGLLFGGLGRGRAIALRAAEPDTDDEAGDQAERDAGEDEDGVHGYPTSWVASSVMT